jgi:Response regulator
MAETCPWIAVVDDDPAVLKALSRLLRSRAFRVQTFESGQDFLAALPHGLPECLIVDLQMPGMSGLDLQQHLARNGIPIPTL